MAETWKRRNLPSPMDPKDERPKTTPTNAPKPIFRISPRHNGSILYNSYELRVVANQLNKAIQSLNSSSPTLMSYLKSPFYSHHLESIYKENAKSPKKIKGSHFTRRSFNKRVNGTATGGFMSRLWKKVKQGLLWSKQRNEA